jgi:hypothetical protein
MAMIPQNIHWKWFVAVIISLAVPTGLFASYSGILRRVLRKDREKID